MCYGCIVGDLKGLSLKISENINYQNLDEETLKNFSNDISLTVTSILNIPIDFLFDDNKMDLLTKFINIGRLLFISREKITVDYNDFLINPEKISHKIALFQNLNELIIGDATINYCYSNNINFTYTHLNNTLIFDGDSKIEKYTNIPTTVTNLNIINTERNLKIDVVDCIDDYIFLPYHIEYLHFGARYLTDNYSHSNLPTCLEILKFSHYDNYGFLCDKIKKNSKIPFNCKIIFSQY
jgi:hypothetical protein